MVRKVYEIMIEEKKWVLPRHIKRSVNITCVQEGMESEERILKGMSLEEPFFYYYYYYMTSSSP